MVFAIVSVECKCLISFWIFTFHRNQFLFRKDKKMKIYTIHKDCGFEIPCFDKQDEALAISAQSPVGDMFLFWQGVETASPCWVRFKKGSVDHYVAAFLIEIVGGQQAIVVALSKDGEVVFTHCAALDRPDDGNYYAMSALVEAEIGPTCMGPQEE